MNLFHISYLQEVERLMKKQCHFIHQNPQSQTQDTSNKNIQQADIQTSKEIKVKVESDATKEVQQGKGENAGKSCEEKLAGIKSSEMAPKSTIITGQIPIVAFPVDILNDMQRVEGKLNEIKYKKEEKEFEIKIEKGIKEEKSDSETDEDIETLVDDYQVNSELTAIAKSVASDLEIKVENKHVNKVILLLLFSFFLSFSFFY